MQGISEAELIFREAMPFEIKAIFLIHKNSGLIISTVQQDNKENELGGDLMAGMLTAMRSFALSCVIENGSTSELKEIEYENFHIMMEVAGYCYLATILKGETDPGYVKKLRRSLGQIILQYDRDGSIQEYSGDPESINGGVHEELQNLLEYRPTTANNASQQPPFALFAIIFVPVLIWGGWSFQHHREVKVLQAINDRINVELNVDPQLAVYPIQAEALRLKGDRHQIHLTGKLPSERLKHQAETITSKQITQLEDPSVWQIQNDIVTVELVRDPEAIADEVTRLTSVLNQDEDIILTTKFAEEQVIVTGYVRTETKLQQISHAFSQIPGVKNVLLTPTAKAFPIDQQFYFSHQSATIQPNDLATKLPAIADFLKQYPQMQVRIVGYTHPNEKDKNLSLARRRAKAVQQGLIELGVAGEQLATQGALAPPTNLTQTDQPWLSQTVQIERIMGKLGEN
jgi:outer membrane protein OmpA-like peptidoglycan-associated protein